MHNPFQSANLRSLPWWRGIELHDGKNQAFEQLTQELEAAFRKTVEDGRLSCFGKEYRRITGLMAEELPNDAVLQSIIDNAFRRLIAIYCYLRQRTKSLRSFTETGSVAISKIAPHLLSKAIEQADRMQRSGVSHERFNLKSAPDLNRWIFEHYWSSVNKYCGIAVLPIPYAHIRFISSDLHGGEYKHRFRYHHFGSHHYDEDVYSLPLIIYLSDVSQNCGPFEYLSASDKFSHNFVLRAFHQALNHDCQLSSLDDSSFPLMARLPSVFRGGDVFGNLYQPVDFERAGPVTVNGAIGTAIMFDGFNVIHAGGLPSVGARKSLFVNFRFPVAKLRTKVGRLIAGKR